VAARHDAHRFRARSSAILTGINTVVADDPALTARLETGEDVLQPVRIVLDSTLRMPTTAQLLQTGSAIIVTTSTDPVRIRELTEAGADVVRLQAESNSYRVDLHAVERYLADTEYNEIWVEAGAVLNGALLEKGLVDEWVVYLAPCVLGSSSRGLFDLARIERMSDRYELHIADIRQIGRDLRMRLLKASPSKEG
jgi:diaminohydroxyphosphoribosylaminopyrimidine deaminase/5-amino-6-(5-phosphoribosylamino)uracil reductase